ncbi:hypothetical protein Ddye_027246 [Dipteronia dyeriana]|uniref:Uncharacterized protein n=1 Tax=Dipteronia dyeriana TaxID=168575 RepID=A0AAD9WQA8_9ROSI|nr:hypothetical protein Ddye_027246 [Dipteronia dyeriana]
MSRLLLRFMITYAIDEEIFSALVHCTLPVKSRHVVCKTHLISYPCHMLLDLQLKVVQNGHDQPCRAETSSKTFTDFPSLSEVSTSCLTLSLSSTRASVSSSSALRSPPMEKQKRQQASIATEPNNDNTTSMAGK